MDNLAGTYRALGRHAEALAIREQVVEFLRLVLPANHPSIGEGCAFACGVTIERGLGFLGLILTCRHGHEQPCYDVQRPWKARGCACNV